jgi:two-component system phosphate regulon sensor histidine kinase PhoR
MKNSSQLLASFFISVSLTLIVLLVLILLKPILNEGFSEKYFFLIPSIFGILSFIISYFLISLFIFDKVNSIYKLIEDFRQDDRGGKPQNILDAIESKVTAFSLQKSAEIQQLKKMEQYRKEFLGNVSHELKTPIFNIQGYLETLIDGGLDDARIRVDYLNKASNNAERLSEIVADLLLISQYESGELKLDFENYNLVEQIEDTFESFSIQAKGKGIELRFKEKNSEPIFVKADKVRIAQVLNNLISNAIKYGSENGFVSVSILQQAENILVEITDNGPGIATEHLGRLFERFYRVDKARAREKGGTGLGLAIVKHIIEAHKQSVSVQSTVGIGTSFSFTLAKPN